MKQVAGLLSTYSSDEFGICSALYELGGMVVMHDASGCNSTYTTHDEPRWYDMDSMIFISAVSEMEAIMGDDEKLIRDITETAKRLQPRFIAVVGAPIPYMIGTDLEAVAALVQRETGIISMGFAANGMHHYTKGIAMALEAVVERFCERGAERDGGGEIAVNIVGATPLDFAWNGSVDSIRKWLAAAGMRVNACLAMGSSLDEIAQAGRAHVNLVVSYGGLAAAEKMCSIFGTPYVVGVPIGKKFASSLAESLRLAVSTGENIVGYQTGQLSETPAPASSEGQFAIIRESVYAASLAAALALERGVSARVLCPLDTEDFLLREGDIRTPEEDDIIRELEMADYVIADEMYRPVCQRGQMFYPLPHEAFSGRIYDAVNPDLINRPL